MQTESRPNEFRITLAFAVVVAALIVVSKMAPYYLPGLGGEGWNFVPIGALGLFIGSRLRSRWAYLLPLAAMLLADVLLIPKLGMRGMESMDLSTPFTYAGFLLYVAVGRLVPVKDSPATVPAVGAAALAGSGLFFLVSNFGSWVAQALPYERSLAGLMHSYNLGVPFYWNTLKADLIFPFVFFGLHAILLRAAAPARAEQPA